MHIERNKHSAHSLSKEMKNQYTTLKLTGFVSKISVSGLKPKLPVEGQYLKNSNILGWRNFSYIPKFKKKKKM